MTTARRACETDRIDGFRHDPRSARLAAALTALLLLLTAIAALVGPGFGLRIPLHTLDAPPETVIASIERFRPVMPPR